MSYVAVSPIGRAAAATVLWRHRGQRYVTAIAKGTFALAAEARMAQLDPTPIAFGEQDDPYGVGLISAGEVAPYLHRVDVTVVGHVELPPHFGSDDVHVELELANGREVLLDRPLVLDGSKRVGPELRHVHVQGMGPLSRAWPVRASHLGGADPASLTPPDMTIPDDFDWAYFQSAPVEQRLEKLAGDEWLVLGGFFTQRPRLRTLLPASRGVARLYRATDAEPRHGEPIAMHVDMLHVDVDAHTCSIVWRGYTALGDAASHDVHVVAGVEMPGQPLQWFDPIARAEQRASEEVTSMRAPPSRPWEPSGAELGETVMLTTDDVKAG